MIKYTTVFQHKNIEIALCDIKKGIKKYPLPENIKEVFLVELASDILGLISVVGYSELRLGDEPKEDIANGLKIIYIKK